MLKYPTQDSIDCPGTWLYVTQVHTMNNELVIDQDLNQNAP